MAPIHKGGLHLTHGLNLHLHKKMITHGLKFAQNKRNTVRGPILDARKARYA